MSLRGVSRTRGLMVLLIPVVLVFLLLRQMASDLPGSTSAGDLALLANPSSSTSVLAPALIPTSTAAVVATATPASTATPTRTPTPTPQPNHYIWIPWRSQFDGTPYASGNCGPASLGMAMSYYGEWWSTSGIRKSTIEISGAVAYDEGTDWPQLKYAAEKRDFKVVGLLDSAGGYRHWTVDDLMKEVEKGHPLLLLVLQRALPGHTDSNYYGDHYIVFLGLMADGRVVYHDSAFYDEIDGSYRIMSQETLMKAWANTSVGLKYTAVSLVWEGESRKWDEATSASNTPLAGN